ncbi:MAG: hypothetical protein NWE76_10255 [Candidatus Bathyarchaeota archaeon]|nr:hypothetical protein [Candidatus Bathyarchaeota archaeon]
MREEFWLVRAGRGGLLSYKDRMTLMYLARIAVKSEVDSSQFHRCVVEAWNQEESKCEQLIVRCRKKTDDSAIFLFTTNQKVVAQFSIPIKILQGKNQIDDYMRMISDRESSAKNFEARNPKIKDLKAGMKQVGLKATVLEIPKPKMVYTRFGTEAHISNALIADETGTIRMSLWNQQINMVSRGDSIEIENSKVVSFRGERQLRIGRNGTLSVIPQVNEKKKGY